MKRLERLLLLALVLGAGLWAFLFSLANSEPVALDLVFVSPGAGRALGVADRGFRRGRPVRAVRGQRGNLAYAARPVAFAARTCGADGRTATCGRNCGNALSAAFPPIIGAAGATRAAPGRRVLEVRHAFVIRLP